MADLSSNQTAFLRDAREVAARIPDGALVAMPPDYSLPAMEVVRELVRRKARNLRLLGVPVLGMCADLLIGAGCVAEVESSAVTLNEAGAAPRFTEAAERGEITVRDSTCPMVHSALQAAEKGVPFMPLRGLIGSDVLKYRDDWKVIDSPFGNSDPIVLLPAINPDVALFHAPLADEHGNVWIGRQRELVTMAHASKRTIVTVERIEQRNLLDDPLTAAGTLPGFYVDAIAIAENGAWPLPLPDRYRADVEHLKLYAKMAASEQGFAEYVGKYVHENVA